MKLIAITGGIGSGKSVVSRVLTALGYMVYDCDSRAKVLMDNSDEIMSRIAREIDETAVDIRTRTIDRRRLAEVVFSDENKLNLLNSIVHGAVRKDISEWCALNHTLSRGGLLFVETAILYQSELDLMVDEVWEVNASRDIRIERIMCRGVGMTREEAEARIESQERYVAPRCHPCRRVIDNSGSVPVLPRILALLSQG